MPEQNKLTDRLTASNSYYGKSNKKRLSLLSKILLGIAALLAMFIVLYETNQPNSSSGQALKEVPTLNQTGTEQSDPKLDQEYYELMKKGQKYIATERADSIIKEAAKLSESIESVDEATVTTPPPKITQETNTESQTEPKATQKKPEPTSAQTTSPAEVTTAPILNQAVAANSTQGNDGLVEEVYYPAQSISGVVTSTSDSSGLSGVNVMVKSGSQSTVTDFNGNYTLNLPAGPGPRIVQFNYQGNRVEREVRPGRNTINAKF